MLTNVLRMIDAQSIINAKICLVLFLVLAIVATCTKKIKPWQFLLGGGLSMGLGYYLLVKNLQLPFWGLKGDELTIAAMYNTFARTGFWADFSYHNLPPFYPPLYFWVTTAIGKIFSLSAIGMMKLGSALAFTFFPIIIYLIQKFYWRYQTKIANLEVAMLSAPLLIMLFVNVDEILGKPYELLAAAGAIYWLLFLYLEIKKPKFSWLKILIFAVAGALIFMSYYLWLVFAVIALAISGLTISKKDQWHFFGRSFIILSLAILFSTPYLAPLISSYVQHGTENWQAGFFTIDNINWRTLFFDSLNWKTLLMFAGLASIIYNYRDNKFKPLIATIATTYTWWCAGLITLTIFQVPMQEFRGFYYFMPATLAIGLSFGLAQLWTYLDQKKNGQKIKYILIFSGLLIFINYSVLGTFIDDPIVRDRLVASKKTEERFTKLSGYLNSTKSDPITLNSVPELTAFSSINNFIYFNQHNSHPGANFSQRFYYVQELSTAKNSQDFYNKTQTTPFGKIQRLILYRVGKNYPLFFHTDKMIAGIEEHIINLPDKLITEPYFRLAYKYYDFEIWETR